MHYITMIFPKGPTTLPQDQAEVQIVRVAHTAEQVTAIQKAAVLLDAIDISIKIDQ